jgi:hypothetical protein
LSAGLPIDRLTYRPPDSANTASPVPITIFIVRIKRLEIHHNHANVSGNVCGPLPQQTCQQEPFQSSLLPTEESDGEER